MFVPEWESLERETGKKFNEHVFQSSRLGEVPKAPFPFLREESGRLEDFLDTGFASLYLISDRAVDIFRKEGITGWETYPAELKTKRGEVIKGYSGFRVSGVCGPVRWSRAPIVQRVVGNGETWDHYAGYPADMGAWDGSDFFIPQGVFGYLITDRVFEVLMRHKITNVDPRPIADEFTPVRFIPPELRL